MIPDHLSRQLIPGQLPNLQTLVTRKDHAAGVIYRFPLGFEIHATIRGVRFAGESANFDNLTEFHTILRWAETIHEEMKTGRGIPPQVELVKAARIRIREEKLNSYRGWWVGNPNAYVTGRDIDTIYRRLRSGE